MFMVLTSTSLTLPGLARRSDKPSPPGGVPEGVGGRRPRIVKEVKIYICGIMIIDN